MYVGVCMSLQGGGGYLHLIISISLIWHVYHFIIDALIKYFI